MVRVAMPAPKDACARVCVLVGLVHLWVYMGDASDATLSLLGLCWAETQNVNAPAGTHKAMIYRKPASLIKFDAGLREANKLAVCSTFRLESPCKVLTVELNCMHRIRQQY